jgi:hypothetical protein
MHPYPLGLERLPMFKYIGHFSSIPNGLQVSMFRHLVEFDPRRIQSRTFQLGEHSSKNMSKPHFIKNQNLHYLKLGT